jgi:integrase
MARADMGVKVRFKKGSWWIVIDHKGHRRSKKIGDRETALVVAKRIRAALAAGDLRCIGPEANETVESYANEWLKSHTGNLKASTIKFYGDNLRRHVLPALGIRPLADLTRLDCRTFIADLRGKKLKLNTVKGIVRTLSTMLSQAVEDEKLMANPALRPGRYLRRGDEPKPEINPLTRDEAGHLVATAKVHFPRWYAFVLCALRTGLRLGELLALQWGDLDWNSRFLLVQRNIVYGVITSPKSHQRRRVDMSAQLTTALLEWRRHLRARALQKGTELSPWVFPSLIGTELEARNVRHVFKRLLEKAELRNIRVHDLRHTNASLLLQQGESIVYVKEQLGHASIQITVDTYGHLIPGANRGAVDRLDDASTQPSATQAQPEPFDASLSADEVAEMFENGGEPRRNRTYNPQIKSLLLCQLS